MSLVSWSASSTARKLSPGTVKMRSQPWILSWSTRMRPPVLAPVGLVMGGAVAAGGAGANGLGAGRHVYPHDHLSQVGGRELRLRLFPLNASSGGRQGV